MRAEADSMLVPWTVAYCAAEPVQAANHICWLHDMLKDLEKLENAFQHPFVPCNPPDGTCHNCGLPEVRVIHYHEYTSQPTRSDHE